jgi:hypothetical protein
MEKTTARNEREMATAKSRFLTGLDARFGMTK